MTVFVPDDRPDLSERSVRGIVALVTVILFVVWVLVFAISSY